MTPACPLHTQARAAARIAERMVQMVSLQKPLMGRLMPCASYPVPCTLYLVPCAWNLVCVEREAWQRGEEEDGAAGDAMVQALESMMVVP